MKFKTTVTIGGLALFALVLGCMGDEQRDPNDDIDTATYKAPCEVDCDSDGYSVEEGDCDDDNFAVGPFSLEDRGDNQSGNGVDDDCDGETDESVTCQCDGQVESALDAMKCATEVGCFEQFLLEASMNSPTEDVLDGSFEVMSHFGSPTNDLAPRGGQSYGYLTTGCVGDDLDADCNSGGRLVRDPFSVGNDGMYDAIEYELKLKAPHNAEGFSFDYVFFSMEYDEFIGKSFNDKFYVILDAPWTTAGEPTVINYTDCRYPQQYHDFDSTGGCRLESGYCCYVAINSALSDCCWLDGCPNGTGGTDIMGTGFECAALPADDREKNGSSTGWLNTAWSIFPGEEFTLTFHLHDTNDDDFNSSVLLDNFRWMMTPVAAGTTPVE